MNACKNSRLGPIILYFVFLNVNPPLFTHPSAGMEDNNGIWKLAEYEPETMLRPDYTVMMVGARGSGKTVMMLYFLQILSKVLDVAIAFIPTVDTQHEFEKHIQKCFVYPDYSEEQLTKIVNAQRNLSKRKPKRLPDGKLEMPKPRKIGIILDDCMYDKKSGKGDTLRYLFMNGRHDDFFFMNAVQYVMDMSKALRSQIDLVVAFPATEECQITSLRENLLGCFKTDAQLSRMFKEGLHENEALVFDRRRANKKQTHLFYCKAKFPLPRFRVGCDLFWLWYYKHFVRKSFASVEAMILNKLQSAKNKTLANAPTDPKAVTTIHRVGKLSAKKKKEIPTKMAASLPDFP